MSDEDVALEAKRFKTDREQSGNIVSLFNVKLLREKLDDHFCNLKEKEECTTIYTQTRLYKIHEIFGDDYYWKNKIQRERFEKSSGRGILYRPGIVDQMVKKIEDAFRKNTPAGVMVMGPQGIGKSHSLVNLVRKLQFGSQGKYLVTFIPDCRSFRNVYDLYEYICQSFGTTNDELSLQVPQPDNTVHFDHFINEIDTYLMSQDKQWVFVFDQINALFARENVKDYGNLKFPFSVYDNVMSVERITSIISASANNEASYKESHRGFEEYKHRFSMDEVEVALAFPIVVIEGKMDTTIEVTGGVPLQVEKLSGVNFFVDKYKKDGSSDIRNDLCKLMEPPKSEMKKQAITDSAVACVLLLKVRSAVDFDRKYSAYDEENGYYKPVYPLVLDAYQEFFWESLIKTLNEKEAQILLICDDDNTTNDTRGRCFELLVIMRCFKYAGVAELNWGGAQIKMPPCAFADRFEDMVPKNGLPGKDVLSKNGIYVPYNPNFPAIDFIWKDDKVVWGVQVHTSAHRDVLPDFKSMCRRAKWHELFTGEIYLLYISPKGVAGAGERPPAVQSPDELRVQPSRAVIAPKSPDELRITVVHAGKNDLTCLQGLLWPERR